MRFKPIVSYSEPKSQPQTDNRIRDIGLLVSVARISLWNICILPLFWFISRSRFTPLFLHNPHILTSYRVYFTPRLAVASLFRWHNETVNIWTHLAPCFYFLWRMYTCLFMELPATGQSMMQVNYYGSSSVPPSSVANTADYLMFIFFYLTILTCFWWSAVYHALGCCSYDTHRGLYRCDIAGILALIWGSYIPALHYAFRCRPMLQLGYSTIITLLVLTLLIIFNTPRCHHRQFHSLRVGALVATIAFAILPTIHWILLVLPHDFPQLQLATFLVPLIGMLSSYGIGFVFYSKNIPERWSPGRFDLIFQSHNFWHCWIVLAGWIWEGELKQMFLRKSMAMC